MENIAGPPVEGSNFFGREDDLGAMRETLEQHDITSAGPSPYRQDLLRTRHAGEGSR